MISRHMFCNLFGFLNSSTKIKTIISDKVDVSNIANKDGQSSVYGEAPGIVFKDEKDNIVKHFDLVSNLC